ncbi:NYN domain-containing protein [Demequina oxidasica]|uniref:NYN domain-containing protein n=1 Tax=Demequina oxidasica TaxID=676199 RepID=UPI0007820F74|nr:NYN domain-containing protein [Demequina oxidasica]
MNVIDITVASSSAHEVASVDHKVVPIVRKFGSISHDGAAGRRLIVADLENLLGCKPADAEPSLWDEAFEGLVDSIAFDAEVDQLVIGVDPQWAFTVFELAPAARLVTRSGESGADIALCEVLSDYDFIARRFTEVVIASGDHEFVRSVGQLRHRNVLTTIASRGAGLNCTLAVIADRVINLATPMRHELALAA